MLPPNLANALYWAALYARSGSKLSPFDFILSLQRQLAELRKPRKWIPVKRQF